MAEIQAALPNLARENRVAQAAARYAILQSQIARLEQEPDEFDCSLCKRDNPTGRHVTVNISGVCIAKDEAQPIFKDCAPHDPALLVLCYRCAVKLGVATDEEVADAD